MTALAGVVAFVVLAALAAVVRTAVGDRLNGASPGGWALPWGTLTVNVVASGLLGLLLATDRSGRWWTIAVSTGGLGALSTWSTFAVEVVELARARQWRPACGYLGATIVLAVAAARLGLALG